MSRTATMQKLDFTEKLLQTGKGGATSALLTRLKTLHHKLAALDQDVTEIKSLNAVRKQLIDQIILHHKDRGVKAYAACCIADLLRLYAPDAPYTADELRDIFEFFVVQISQNLKPTTPAARPLAPSKRSNARDDSQRDSQSQSQSQTASGSGRLTEIPYYKEYAYLIRSLASIKSIVLICDLPASDELITTYFNSFVEVVRPDMNKTVLRDLVNMLAEVLNESNTVPAGVMDCIFGQFEAYATRPETPSFQFIADVCNRAVNKLQRPTYAHFSEIQLTHGRDPSTSDFKTLSESHELILTIFRNVPNLLLNVIPLLEENLRAADEVPLRQLSTKTLGAMFGERPLLANGVVDLARAYPSAWRAWLGRKVDKALPVRLAWVEAAGGILVNHPEVRRELEIELMDRIQDSDERVRAAICKVIGSLDYETALHHVSKSLLQAVGGRMGDKKAVVRTEAINALAKLWGLAYSEIEANDEDAIDHFGWIPQEMLVTTFRRDATVDLKTQISLAFKNSILPLPSKPDDEQAWVDRFLLVASQLDDNGLKGLDRITGLVGYAKGSSPYRAFVEVCEENNGGVIESSREQHVKDKLAYVIDAIARMTFGDPDKARKDMEAFASANEPRMYKLFKALVNPQSDLRAIIKSKNELLRRIEQSHTSILETFTVLIDLAGWMVINHSSIPCLIKRLQKPDGPLAEVTPALTARFLSLIAKECAPMYKSHVPELVIIIGDKRNDLLVEVGLQALSAVCKWEPESGPSDKRAIDRAFNLARSGTPRQAKFASRFIAYCNSTSMPGKLVKAIAEDLQDPDEENLLPLLRSCSELALSAPAAFETKSEEILNFILSDIMNRRSPSEDDLQDGWVEEDELEVLDRAKIISLRVCTHRALGWARDPNAPTLVEPTLGLLLQVLKNDGQVTDDTMEGGRARLHMRLRAALCLLKLANVRAYDKVIAPFSEVAFIVQDAIFAVRHRLLKKLAEVLPLQRLLPRWNLLPVLVAQDPEAENIVLARNIMGMVVRRAQALPTEQRIDRIEMPLARLLHVLTEHPDLDWTSESELKEISRFIQLFIESVAQRENIALLFNIATKLKTVCVVGEMMDDAKLRLLLNYSKRSEAAADQDDDNGDEAMSSPTLNLYKLSELAQIIIRNRAQHMQWPLSLYPGKFRLPRDIFNNLPTASIAQQISGKTYLNESVASWAKNLGKKAVAVGGPTVRSSRPRAERSERKRTRATGPRAPRKKRRASMQTDDDDDEDDDDESSSDDDEDGDVDMEDIEEESGDDGDAQVMGRGGRRGAKAKANRAVTRKSRAKASASKRRQSVQSVESD